MCCSYNNGGGYEAAAPPSVGLIRGSSIKPGEVTNSTAGAPVTAEVHSVSGLRQGKYVVVKQREDWYTVSTWCRIRATGFVMIDAQVPKPLASRVVVHAMRVLCR